VGVVVAAAQTAIDDAPRRGENALREAIPNCWFIDDVTVT